MYLFFPVVLAKNGNRRQLNASVPPSPYPILFRITRESNYTRWFLDQNNFEKGVERGLTFSV